MHARIPGGAYMQAVRGDNIASHCHDPLFGERRLSSYEKVLEIRVFRGLS